MVRDLVSSRFGVGLVHGASCVGLNPPSTPSSWSSECTQNEEVQLSHNKQSFHGTVSRSSCPRDLMMLLEVVGWGVVYQGEMV
jgi:hypothetical protein